MIHPTAVVSPSAVLGQDVEIGPYCVIGDGVKLGDRCRLHSHVTLDGPSVIGPDNEFFPHACVGQRSQDLKYAGEPTYLEIGEKNSFREFCTVNRGTLPESRTVIGNHNHFLAYTHIAHDCTVGNHVIFSNNGTLAGHVVVGDHAILGGFTAVHQFCRIGQFAITGGCSKIVQDVPPFMTVDGNPAEVRSPNLLGLQRHGFPDEDIRALKDAYKVLFMRRRNMKTAVEEVTTALGANPQVASLCDFIRATERGVTR